MISLHGEWRTLEGVRVTTQVLVVFINFTLRYLYMHNFTMITITYIVSRHGETWKMRYIEKLEVYKTMRFVWNLDTQSIQNVCYFTCSENLQIAPTTATAAVLANKIIRWLCKTNRTVEHYHWFIAIAWTKIWLPLNSNMGYNSGGISKIPFTSVPLCNRHRTVAKL